MTLEQYKSSLTTVSKTNFGSLTSCWAGTEMFFVGRGVGWALINFLGFRVGTLSRWELIRRWTVIPHEARAEGPSIARLINLSGRAGLSGAKPREFERKIYLYIYFVKDVHTVA